MMRRLFSGFVLVALSLLVGCVERRFIIYSQTPDQAGAAVYDPLNNFIGFTPVDLPFTYYGKYRFRVVKDGYETLNYEYNAKAPWYEWPGLDFISENLWPFPVRDIRYVPVHLQPLQPLSPDALIQQGSILRERGHQIAQPLPKNEKQNVNNSPLLGN
jgi:hypothetical protein